MKPIPLYLALAAALASTPLQAKKDRSPTPPPAAPETYASTYKAVPYGPVLLRGATVLTGTGERLDGADVLMRDGRIAAVGVWTAPTC